MRLFVEVPPEPIRAMTAPPTAWRTTSTVSLLKSIIPSTEPLEAPAPPGTRVASDLRAAMLAAQAEPVEEASAPAPTTTVAVVPWPAEPDARSEPRSADRASVEKRSFRTRALLIFLSVIGAALTPSRAAGTAHGREVQPPSSSGENASARKDDGAAGS
jgi:hypothetical protein